MPDVELLLVAWLNEQLSDVRVCAELPATLPAQTVRVNRIGGPRLYALDRPTVVVDVFAGDRGAAFGLAQQVEDLLYLKLPGVPVNGAAVSHVATISGPSWAPYDNTGVRRVTATYQMHVKTV